MDTFMIAIGGELIAARERNGWIRRDVQRRLPFDVSVQTVASWELGTRNITAERLYLLCTVLGEPVEDVLARARKRIEKPSNAEFCLDLKAAARTTRAALVPLRAWAQCMLRQRPNGDHVMPLNLTALDRLAEVCSMTTLDLIGRLTRNKLGGVPDVYAAQRLVPVS